MPSLARAESNHLFGRDEPRHPLHSSSLRVPRNFPPPRPLPRVNVYLCIKQALFIRAMNMHCLVAVARCRVQTRRYHCLINHIQSQRPTLRAPFSSHSIPCVLRSPLLPSLCRGPAEDPPCHPTKLSTAFPLAVFSISPFLSPLALRPSPRKHHPPSLPPAGRN